jgi:signal transduction histidine kinase
MTFAVRKSIHALLLLALLPVALVLGWQAWSGIRADRDRIQDELDRAAIAFAQSVDNELQSSIDALTVLSQSEIFQQGRIAAMGALLRGRPRRDWDSIFLLDANGAVVLDTAPRGSSSLPPAALRELHAQVLRRAGPVVSGTTGSPGIAIATAIVQSGRVRYVLGVRTSDTVWQRLPSAVSLPEGGQARLVDAQGRPITGGPAESQEEDSYDSSATVPLAGWRADVWVPAAPIDAQHRRTIVATLSTSGASLVAGFVLAAWAARRVARKLEQQARARDEHVSRLNHELRNGLNAIRAAADVLESVEPGSEPAREARSIIARQTRAMSNTLHDGTEGAKPPT